MKTISKIAISSLSLLSISGGVAAMDGSQIFNAYLLTRGSFEYNLWAQNYELNGSDDGSDNGYSAGITYSPETIIFPNYRAYSTKISGNNLSYRKYDITAYYNVIKAPMARLSLGGGATQAYGDQYIAGYGRIDDYAGHFYSALDVGNEDTKVHLYSQFMLGTGMYDITAGVKYPIKLDKLGIEFQAGYRQLQIDFNEFADINYPAEQTTSGFFAGINIMIF